MLSVVIPTRNRREALIRTLRSLERQRRPAGDLEVVVADNGSGDGSAEAVRELAASSSLAVRLVEEPRPGPAAARNRGVEEASGELVLFLGDDTEAAGDDLVARHVELHGRASDPKFAVLGLVTWSGRQPVSPFMDWLERGGYQFAYGSLENGRVSAGDAFWTAHVSLSRELFEQAGGFDERFPFAAVEDVELGARLERAGMALEYHPELLVLHTHPIDLGASLERLRRVGRSAALLHQIDPGWNRPGLPRPGPVRSRLVRGSAPLWRALAALGRPRPLRDFAWRAMHIGAYARGFREGPPSVPAR